mmetsp:Transcript_21939/g.62275  ORF Transcript_21939/g.62275 Transcript_21939/m.62275 type:complete len:277 (+) Transcript_21939:549-1379(+)
MDPLASRIVAVPANEVIKLEWARLGLLAVDADILVLRLLRALNVAGDAHVPAHEAAVPEVERQLPRLAAAHADVAHELRGLLLFVHLILNLLCQLLRIPLRLLAGKVAIEASILAVELLAEVEWQVPLAAAERADVPQDAVLPQRPLRATFVALHVHVPADEVWPQLHGQQAPLPAPGAEVLLQLGLLLLVIHQIMWERIVCVLACLGLGIALEPRVLAHESAAEVRRQLERQLPPLPTPRADIFEQRHLCLLPLRRRRWRTRTTLRFRRCHGGHC